ncbi:hypothetical protein [Kitasatospora sp. NPDC057015]|uniref:hypothetical protein n=1 Tax=Kitasatospora sp. NPDC057015 TaxID=3346001 RepID=UPI0036299B64
MTAAPIAVPLPVPVHMLMERSGQPQDVPDTGAALAAGWLPAVAGAVLSLLANTDPANAALSHTAPGRTDLYLGRNGEDTLHLRIHAAGDPHPYIADDKSAALTLSGAVLLEGYTDDAHIQAGHPQYVREFRPESAYFCYPDTPITVTLTHDACQLIVTRDPAAPLGPPLTADGYLNQVKAASQLLTRAFSPTMQPHPLPTVTGPA